MLDSKLFSKFIPIGVSAGLLYVHVYKFLKVVYSDDRVSSVVDNATILHPPVYNTESVTLTPSSNYLQRESGSQEVSEVVKINDGQHQGVVSVLLLILFFSWF